MANRLKSYLSENQKLIVLLSLLLLFIILFFIGKCQSSSRNKKLLDHAAFSSGQFTGEIRQPNRKDSNGPWYICYYEVNGKIYTCYEPVHRYKKIGKGLFKQKFPIIYDSTDPGSGRVLVFPSDFEELNLKFPDSLYWILSRR